MVEYKVGARSTLMEINGRIWGSLPLATISGMDFPGKLAAMHMEPPEEPLQTDTHYRVGQRAFNLELIVKWILVVLIGRRRYPFPPTPRRRDIPRVLIGVLSPWQRFDVTAWDDPKPTLAEVGKIVRRLVGKVR
jgi:hypothetical protein